MSNHIYDLHTKECVVYIKNRGDSHKSFDKKTKIYTFPADGEYLIGKDDLVLKDSFKKGEFIKNPDWVIGQKCGQAYIDMVDSLEEK